MDKESLYCLAQGEVRIESSDIESLRDAVQRYPYFDMAKYLYLKAIYEFEPTLFAEELTRLSVLLSDREALFYYIFQDDFEALFQKTGKQKLEPDKTKQLLDAFFEVRDSADTDTLDFEVADGNALVSTDYLSYLKEEKNEKAEMSEFIPLKHQSVVDGFLEKAKNESLFKPIDETSFKEDKDHFLEDSSGDEYEPSEDVFFTETLAKIYIKQGRFEKAYEIIKHLNLKYPKKNIYFADQLKYLEKLIINKQYKDKQ